MSSQDLSARVGSSPPRPGPARRSGLLLVLALALLALAPLAYRYRYDGRIYPGVSVAGIPLGDLEPPAAAKLLSSRGLSTSAVVQLQADEQSWQVQTGRSGLTFDLNATVTEAWQLGRDRALPLAFLEMLAARILGRDIAPQVDVDPLKLEERLDQLAAEFDRPAANARIELVGTELRPTEPIEGRFIVLDEAAMALSEAAERGTWPILNFELPVGRILPEVTDASAALAQAERLMAGPLTLRAEGQSWSLPPEMLSLMLTTRAEGDTVMLDLDPELFEAWMAPVTKAVSRTAKLPRFRFDEQAGALRLLESGESSMQIEMGATIARLLQAGEGGPRLVRIVTRSTPPAVADNVLAGDLGIVELVTESTSRYQGSSPGRIHNIGLATSRYDGLLVPPGATFSFNEHLGEVTEEEGYEETLIIMDGATADGVGGGVCQVSTTLFRSVFFGGFPIPERHAHGYRVAYYEQGSPPGMDATIYSPIIDLKFENDTGAWLLIEAGVNAPGRTATFRIFGTRPNREVELGTIQRSKAVPPPPSKVELDPELAPGQSEIVEHPREGLSVSVQRIIRENGEEREDFFHSTYRPTGEIIAVGSLPEPEPPATPGLPAPGGG